MTPEVTEYRRKLVRGWVADPDAKEPTIRTNHSWSEWQAGVEWRKRVRAADPDTLDALADATTRAAEARARLSDARKALSDENERVARERAAEVQRVEAERRAARRTRFEFGQTREPGKGIIAWPYDAEPEARGVWVVEVRVEDGRATIFAADEPSRVRRERVEALDLRAPTRADLSRYLDVDLLDAVDIEAAVEESPDPVEWVVYDPGKWERKATDVRASESEDEGDSSGDDSVVQAYGDGARTTPDFEKALGCTAPTARNRLRAAGFVKTGRDWHPAGVDPSQGPGSGDSLPADD